MTKTKPTLNPVDIKLLKRIFATKTDLQRFATRKELQKFATKKDLEKFETKQEALKARAKTVSAILDYVDQKLANVATREEIKNLPTKEEFFSRMDKISQEYQTFQIESTTLPHQLDRLLSSHN